MAYLDRFLNVIVKEGGSDLHIAEGEPPKMRMHGDIMPIREELVKREEAVQMLSEVCGPQNWEISNNGAISISLTRWTKLLAFVVIISSSRTATARLFV